MKKLVYFLLLFSVFSYGQLSHKVLKGETMYGISNKYNISISELKESNPFLNQGLKIGQILTIPTFKRPVVALDSIGSRIILAELTDCDYVKKELSLADKEIKKTEDIVKTKSQVVDVLTDERKVVNNLAEANSKLLIECSDENKKLKKDNDSQKRINTWNKVLYFLIGGAAGYGIGTLLH